MKKTADLPYIGGPLYIRGMVTGEGGPYIGGPLYIRGVVTGEGGRI